MPYKLNAKLIPFLIEEESTGLIAKVTQVAPGYVNLQLSEGVMISVKEEDLGMKLSNNTTGKLYFDGEGNYLNASLSKLPKLDKSVLKGCMTRPQAPDFN